MNFNNATAARQPDDHAEIDHVDGYDYDEENDFLRENQDLTNLLPPQRPQPLPTERERLVKPLATARGPKNIYNNSTKVEVIRAVATNSKVLSGRIE